RALDSMRACPGHHLFGGDAILDAAKANLAEEADSGGGEFLEVVLRHARLDHRRTRMDFDTAGPKSAKGALGEDRHRFEPGDIARTAGGMDFSGRDHRGDAAREEAVDPVQLTLPRGQIAGDRMNVTIDQSRGERRSHRVDKGGNALIIEIFLAPERGDSPAN